MIAILAFVDASATSLLVFAAICIAILASFVGAAGYTATSRTDAIRVMWRLGVGLALYCSAIAGLVYSGLFERAFLPFGPMFLVGTVALAVAVAFTPLGFRIAKRVPIAWLVLFQAFRLPLELVLHDWHSSGTVPETMTWTGSNWDIVTGVMACLACAFVGKSRWLAWLFNVVGIVLLLNVGRVAILSSPVPFGWDVEPKLELILYLPYAYIVPLCVGGAALGHAMLTRRLVSQPATKAGWPQAVGQPFGRIGPSDKPSGSLRLDGEEAGHDA